MNKGLKKKLALILAFVMVMSTGIANVFTAYADDDMVPVTIIKYWEDMGWNGGQVLVCGQTLRGWVIRLPFTETAD